MLPRDVSLVIDMSVYRKIGAGIPNEISVNDLSRRRDAPGQPAAPPAQADVAPHPSVAANDTHAERRAAPANEPFPATFRWIATLPRHVRPVALLQQYPRIANVMARAWGDPAMFRGYVFELLIDRRGGRRGFPEKVRAELLALRTYFDETHPGFDGERKDSAK